MRWWMLAGWFGMTMARTNASTREGAAKNITYPIFAPSGVLIERVKAESGTLSESGPPQLENVTVEVLDPVHPAHVTETIWTSLAFYDEKARRVYGPAEVRLTAPDIAATAVGFELQLDADTLTLQRDVRVHTADGNLSSESAVVTTCPQKTSAKDPLARARRIELRGDVRVVRLKEKTALFQLDEVRTDLAIYAGETGIVTCPHPVHEYRDGREVGSAEHSEYRLRPAATEVRP